MKLDKGREYDLEELDQARRNAPSKFWRDHYEKIMRKIVSEVGLSSLREDLAQAVRHDDHRAIWRIQQEIRHIRLNQTYGKLDH